MVRGGGGSTPPDEEQRAWLNAERLACHGRASPVPRCALTAASTLREIACAMSRTPMEQVANRYPWATYFKVICVLKNIGESQETFMNWAKLSSNVMAKENGPRTMDKAQTFASCVYM